MHLVVQPNIISNTCIVGRYFLRNGIEDFSSWWNRKLKYIWSNWYTGSYLHTGHIDVSKGGKVIGVGAVLPLDAVGRPHWRQVQRPAICCLVQEQQCRMSVRRGQFLAVEDGARVRVVKGSVHLYHSTVHLDLSPTSEQITTSSKPTWFEKGISWNISKDIIFAYIKSE